MPEAVLATLADRKFVQQAKQVFSSVYHNTGWDGDYLLLSHQIPEGELDWFISRGIKIFDCTPLTDRNIGIWPPTLLSKFYLFTDEFRSWSRVVYLDGDVTAEAHLGELGEPQGLMAVPDVHHIPVRDQFLDMQKAPKTTEARNMLRRLEDTYDTGSLSFNAGVFSFSTDIIKSGTFDDLTGLFDQYREVLRFPEQAIMNLYFMGQWTEIPLVYNNYYTRIRRPWRFGTVPFTGICNHYINEKPWIVKDDHFYPVWRMNLDRAGSVDLGNRIPPAKIWTEDEIIKGATMVERSMVHRPPLIRMGDGLITGIEKIAGLGGRIISKVSPGLYRKIRMDTGTGEDK